MKHQKDIFDLFRENQHKLDERPSRRTWQRLERRLDAQHKPGTNNLFRQLSMIAALLAFLVIVSVVVILPQNNQEAQSPLENFEAIPLADLGEEATNTGYEVAVFTKRLHDRLANPTYIAEGKSDKKLLPSTLVSNSSDQFLALNSLNSTVEKINIKPFRLKDTLTALNKPVQSLFNWIVGDWSSENQGQLSMEMWSARDSQTLEGKGFLVKNGDTTFAEKMMISNLGSDIYFSTSLDSGQNQVQYKLTSLDRNKAVFENSKVDFPQQVILQQNSGSNFSTILTNAQPVDMPQSQVGYMQNRNALINQQAIRNLNRIQKK